VQGDLADDGVHLDGRPADALGSQQGELGLGGVIQASGVAAPAGVASATPSTTASRLDCIREILYMGLLLCLKGVL